MSGTRNPRRRRDPGDREIRIAAVGDIHFHDEPGSLTTYFSRANEVADILVICGDLTTHGKPEQFEAFTAELAGVEIPVVCVLGNHDHEADAAEEAMSILRGVGVHVLDGDYAVVDGVGFAGVKGFAGGFGRGALAPFGEKLIKDFVQAAIDEALKLENALRSLRTTTKVVVMHYSPIPDTLVGEPDIILPFLGSSRLLGPVETLDATVVFHGHAHHGVLEAATPAGVPVFNVALPLLQEAGLDFRIWTVSAPDRRRTEGSGAAPPHRGAATAAGAEAD
jgi:Icc-related predicted phosphoesterase